MWPCLREREHGECGQQPCLGSKDASHHHHWSAMKALKAAIVCGLHKLTKCLWSYLPPERHYYHYYYYLHLFLCQWYLNNFCTVGFLCILSPRDAVFSVRSLLSIRSSAAGHRPGLQMKRQINSQLRRIRKVHKSLSNLLKNQKHVFLGLSSFFSSS